MTRAFDLAKAALRPLNAQAGTTYQLLAADLNAMVVGSNAGTKTFTLPAVSALFNGWRCTIANIGAGDMTVARNGVNIDGAAADLTLGQFQAAELVCDGANFFSNRGKGSASAAIPDVTVRCATTANVALATALENGDAIDGVTLVTGDLVLVKDQSTAAQSGVYVVPASGAASRDNDFDTYNEHPGKLVAVQEGTANADTVWLCTSNRGGTLETTAIAWAKYAAAFATVAEYRAGTVEKPIPVGNAWSANAEVTLTDAATIAVDMSAFLDAVVTLAGNRTLGNPTNTKDGQKGRIRVVQDGTGNRTLSYSANWEFAGAAAPVLSTAAGKQDVLYYDVISSTRILATLVKDIG